MVVWELTAPTMLAWAQGDDIMEYSALRVDDIKAIAPLTSTDKFVNTLQLVDEEVARHGDDLPAAWAGPSDADPVYQLLVACNELAMGVDDEIAKVHAYIQEKCASSLCTQADCKHPACAQRSAVCGPARAPALSRALIDVMPRRRR